MATLGLKLRGCRDGAAPLAEKWSLTPRARADTRRPVTNWYSVSEKRQSKEIRRIRRKLGLSQVATARLTGGGHNAFSRYERGEAMPMPAVLNLFRLLDRHPELLKDLVESNSSSSTGGAKQGSPG